MDVKKFNNKIGDLVGEDNLKAALKLLRDLLKNCPKIDEVILQSSRLTDLMRQIRNGTVSFENANLTKNKIRLAILSLSEEIEEVVSESENLKAEFETQREATINFAINQNHSGSGDNIAGNKVINK